MWLWKYLATSELLKGNMKRTIKIFGVVVLAGFIFIISFSLYTALYGDSFDNSIDRLYGELFDPILVCLLYWLFNIYLEDYNPSK